MTNQRNSSPFNSISSLLFTVLLFLGLFWVAKGIFSILSWVSPFLLIATFFIDKSVITDYLKWIRDSISRKPIFGIGIILLTFFGFPVVAGYLFFKAMMKKKMVNMKNEFEQKQSSPFDDYLNFPDKNPNIEDVEYEDLDLEEPPISRESQDFRKDN